MKRTSILLSLVLAFAMVLSLGSVCLAADDWSEYQAYVYAYAEAGAPNPEDAEPMYEAIYGAGNMEEMSAVSELGVFFQVIGVLDYDAWLAAGKPAAEAGSDSASGEATEEPAAEEAATEEPSAEASASGEASSSASAEPEALYGELEGEPGDNAVVSYQADKVVYVSDGEEITVEIGEGQYAYLTVGGVNEVLQPGNYDATVVVEVVDPIFESDLYQTGDKDVNLSTELFSVIYITEDGLQEGQSVLSAAVGGEVTDTSVKGVTIESNDVTGMAGIRAGGSAVVEVEDVVINFTGNGGNDFMGAGAALAATDGSTLIARNVQATIDGWVRGCTFAGGQSRLEVYDSVFICDNGEYDPDSYVSGAGMSQPPNGLGVYGNNRLNNMVHDADEYFERVTFISRNWGALGVDAVTDGTLTCVDCDIIVTECGYGAYSIGPCVDTFTNCRFDITNGVVAFAAVEGTVILNGGTIANSNRYGIVTHQAMGATSTIKVLENSEINAAYCGIMVKGRSSDIEIGDGATITSSETGIILQAQDNDDTGAGSVNAEALVNVDIHDTALEGDIVMSMAPLADSTSTMEVVLTNASITGAVTTSNATLAIPDGNISIDNILDVGMVTNEYGVREDACYLNVTLADGSVWTVTETSYVTNLTVDETATVNGIITETENGYVIEPAAETAGGASLSLTVNGESLADFGIQATKTATGYKLDLSEVLDTLGVEMSYDEATTTVTIVDNNGIIGALMGAAKEDTSIFSVAAGEAYPYRPEPEVIEGERYVGDYLRGASVIYVSGGEYTFDDIYVYGAGYSDEDDLSAERSSQYGYCSNVLATSPESLVTLNNPTIVSDPESYANGVFATNCAKIIVNGGVIDTNNAQGHGLDVTYMGHIYAYDTVIHTAGGSSGALASDYGGGFITAEGIDCTTEMAGSPGIYCAGSSVIYVKDSSFRALNCEGVMSAHDHGVTVLENCYTYGATSALNGHQAMPSPAMSTGSYAFVFGGTLESDGPIVNQNNGRTETTLVGVECITDCENVINADADANGILVLNVWDTELIGNINCEAGASITVNLYDGAKLVGEVTGEGEVIINVCEDAVYEGSYETNVIDCVDTPVCEDFDYYVINYWAAGMQKWQNTTITTYVDEVEPLIIANSAVSFVEEGASAIAYDEATTVVTESGIGMDALDTESAYGFGDPGDGIMGVVEASAEPEESQWDAWIEYLKGLIDSNISDIADQVTGELDAAVEEDYTGMLDGTVYGVFAFMYDALSYEEFCAA